MSIVVIGACGMLGQDLCTLIQSKDRNCTPLPHEKIDITSVESIHDAFKELTPDVIINCAAYTDVDKAEEEFEEAFRVNHVGTKNLADFASKRDIPLCHLSTDYIFDGRKESPYVEDDRPNPLSAYGKSKLAGEEEVTKIEKHYIVRSAWLYGKNGRNFIKTILKASRERDELRVVNDQIGSPTYTFDLGERILEIIDKGTYGTYHATNSQSTSWYELSKLALFIKGIQTPIQPISSTEFPSKVAHPAYSVLSNARAEALGLPPMPDWPDALKRFLDTL